MNEKQKHLDPAGYLSSRTIAALTTPTGGALCVLRISGNQARAIAEALTQRKLEESDHRKAKRVWLHTPTGKRLDDGVMVNFFAPQSFTGEDVVEFSLHGSPIIAQKALEAIFAAGARLALPGEFSFRAVKNGKFTLSQAEAIKELIQADNDFALDLALEKLSGSQHQLISKIRDDLMQLLTLSEVGIDFSDQDIDEVSLPSLRKRLHAITESLEVLRSSFDRGKRFIDGIPVSVLGLPNAGKSSFFNALLGEDRSIVSNIAGTTRDVVREKINLQGAQGNVSFKLSDTAGLRKGVEEIESIGIERSLKAARDSDLILLVIDGANPELAEVSTYFNQIDRAAKQTIGIVTKKDLISDASQNAIREQLAEFGLSNIIFIASPRLEGIDEVAREMARLAEEKLARNPGEVVLTQFEHVQAVNRSLECLYQAKLASDLVLFATSIRHGMNDLGPLIGETLPDDVLGKIFSDFCIGK